MNRDRWEIDVDRVVIHGAGTRGLDVTEVRQLVADAVVARLSVAPLPPGRAMRAEVVLRTGPLTSSGSRGVARAVADGVLAAVSGGRSHG
jgi:hypothetical protein